MHNHSQPKIEEPLKGAVPKVMNVALIELVEMTATLNVVVSINLTTVMQTYWTAPFLCSFTKKRHLIWTTLKQPYQRSYPILSL